MHFKKTVIWDLSGTLLKATVHPLYPEQEQLLSLLVYLWGGKKEASEDDLTALAVLESFGKQHGPHKQFVRLSNSAPLPAILCKWLAGTLSSYHIIEYAHKAIEHNETIAYDQKTTLKKLFTVNFDPTAIVSIMVPMPTMPELIHYAQSHGYQQYLFSNWDELSFNYLYRSISVSSIFSFFTRENIVISADTGFVKPEKGMYDYLITNYSLNPHDCLFIDNQQENIDIAKEYGMTGFLFENNTDVIQAALRFYSPHNQNQEAP